MLCIHIQVFLMSGHNICFCVEINNKKKFLIPLLSGAILLWDKVIFIYFQPKSKVFLISPQKHILWTLMWDASNEHSHAIMEKQEKYQYLRLKTASYLEMYSEWKANWDCFNCSWNAQWWTWEEKTYAHLKNTIQLFYTYRWILFLIKWNLHVSEFDYTLYVHCVMFCLSW